ncbi:MAG: zinc-binding dehydrogenase [Acidimicrobiia bacterium]|nr:zinc-binding dehydrogenase [Acidimicrobiia bacterium]MDX2468790.1 zinc-binding dehydrogenase [Acidimicrobiia bacterium]
MEVIKREHAVAEMESAARSEDPRHRSMADARHQATEIWELMFARSLFVTPDIADQGKLLREVAALVDAGRIQTTATEVAGKIDAATLRTVHAQIETGSALGKIVLEGF